MLRIGSPSVQIAHAKDENTRMMVMVVRMVDVNGSFHGNSDDD